MSYIAVLYMYLWFDGKNMCAVGDTAHVPPWVDNVTVVRTRVVDRTELPTILAQRKLFLAVNHCPRPQPKES